MKTVAKIFLFTILVSAFYSYVGQMVPQQITLPPEDLELSADLTSAELADAGEEIVAGKGTCLTCHTVGSHDDALRFPDLAGIGSRAASRVDGMSAVDYLAESMYDPNAFIVEGFLGGMPNVARPPIALNDGEILAVIAYLESLGGEPSVTMDTELRWQSDDPTPTAAAPAATASAAAGPADGPTVFGAYLCNTCHAVDDPTPLVGPSLYDVGARLSRSELYEAVLEPDATVAEGYPAGIMSATLTATGFNDKVSPAELKALVDYLVSLGG